MEPAHNFHFLWLHISNLSTSNLAASYCYTQGRALTVVDQVMVPGLVPIRD